jgi:hypothetical protein
MIRRPAPGQDAKVERLKRAALVAIASRTNRTEAWKEFTAARNDITWEEATP